jgi:anti-anti-sigma factor
MVTEDYSREVKESIVTERVHLSRATKENAETFKKILLKDIDEGYTRLIVDLSECMFMDSTFLSSLVVALKYLSKTNGTIKLVAIHQDTLAILELTGMVKVFEIFKNRKDALKSFNTK